MCDLGESVNYLQTLNHVGDCRVYSTPICVFDSFVSFRLTNKQTALESICRVLTTHMLTTLCFVYGSHQGQTVVQPHLKEQFRIHMLSMSYVRGLIQLPCLYTNMKLQTPGG